jgi:hypothetical protein
MVVTGAWVAGAVSTGTSTISGVGVSATPTENAVPVHPLIKLIPITSTVKKPVKKHFLIARTSN